MFVRSVSQNRRLGDGKRRDEVNAQDLPCDTRMHTIEASKVEIKIHGVKLSDPEPRIYSRKKTRDISTTKEEKTEMMELIPHVCNDEL